ncbi:C40 family peptidase [Gloeobacter kilaueensis]|uniref:NLP/P60 protein n=1 Tax=Gloeobacter kilaueensis (strain ATCC BAA-2537 / CCAP 1431/1 / ULC 316 / JS1) TaxID=1183438 RepID=U5QG23_GLOK1|nr:SH3 domain-containing C40 family peptidase [Gloeobacter kilaueensis]AGY56594.1 NLP/P60 protein [Gloeobacter kilaueensis JS1]
MINRRFASSRCLLLLALFWGLIALSARAAEPLQPVIDRYIESLPKGYGARAVLTAQAVWQGGRIVLTGQALTERDRQALKSALARLGPVENRMEIFPFAEIGEHAWAAVRLSGADLRAAPDDKSELVSQVLPGDALKVLGRTDDSSWFKVLREWDGYVGWIRADRIVLWSRSEQQNWQKQPHLMVLENLPAVPELPRGSIVARTPAEAPMVAAAAKSALVVATAEGQSYTLPERALRPISPTDAPSAARILQYARALLADQPTRYLWGGTIGRALDCSGFNQTVYRLAGGTLPRDSYQQQAASRPIAPTLGDWQQLQPGDLLFFSEKGNRATHTGIYIGGGHFIHSSGHNNGIAENNLLGNSEYEQLLRRIYFGAGRVLSSTP